MALLEARGLTRIYQEGGERIVALEGIDLDIEEADYVAVVGESGSGKTTLLNLLGALDRPTAGRVRLQGRALESEPESSLVRLRRSLIGFVFQEFRLLEDLSVIGNVMLPLLFNGALDRGERARALLARFGLDGHGHRRASRLSRGEMQRVALARALVASPRIVLADEPTGNLDAANAEIIMRHLGELNRDEGVTILVATHSERLAAGARRVLTLRNGRLLGEAA